MPLAAKAGYQSANLPQVIRMMVAKSTDLARNPDDTIRARAKRGRPPKSPARARRPKRPAPTKPSAPSVAPAAPAPAPA